MKILEKPAISPIGAVFTPLQNAMETVQSTGLYKKWLEGAVILDPTAGSGNFLEALIRTAWINNKKITNSMLSNLYAIEMQKDFIDQFFYNIISKYGIFFPKVNFIQGDYLFTANEIQADFLIGNPPWLNFCDLDIDYKSKIKHFFLESRLVLNKKDLLLGSSRIDIAALIISESIRKNLKDQGQAFFYLPLSLFLNDGAHKGFRSALLGGENFSLDYIHDYKDNAIFPGVSTRYGFARFTKSKKTSFPIDYYKLEKSGEWIKDQASPIGEGGSPYIIHKNCKKPVLPVIHLMKENRPRQGLNTCGANKLFIFDSMEKINDSLCRVTGKGGEAILPQELLFPLIGANQFKNVNKNKYVLFPYNSNGRVKTEDEIKKYPEAYDYLLNNRELLENRKGVLIQSKIQKESWWSLLGVGPYSFAPWKIVWEAFGKKKFTAKIFSTQNQKLWQPNQALQAFLPFYNKKKAEETLIKLQNPVIEQILISQGMEGTCNWAQPGRMMKFFRFKNET